jgi:hypothetical protein
MGCTFLLQHCLSFALSNPGSAAFQVDGNRIPSLALKVQVTDFPVHLQLKLGLHLGQPNASLSPVKFIANENRTGQQFR